MPMDIKVQCGCGARYAFSVEPVNGGMPVAVSCPKCGTDGTGQANQQIQQSLSATAPAAPAVPPAFSAPAPAVKPGLRIGKSHAPEPPAAPQPTVEPAAAEAVPETVTRELPPARKRSKFGEPSVALGIAGALVGAALGAGILWGADHGLGLPYRLVRYMALLVGFLAGGGARLLGRKSNLGIGVAAGLFCAVAIFGTEYFVAKANMEAEAAALPKPETYDERMAHSKEAVALKTDAEIKEFLKRERTDSLKKIGIKDEPKEPIEITAEDIQGFKQDELAAYKEFVNGKPTREEYEKQMAAIETIVKSNPFNQFILVIRTFFGVNLITSAISIGLAYKIGCGAPIKFK